MSSEILKRPTICLNMIVKDESHIILKTLQNICDKINIDYWVICDTGSTDNTPEIIQNFFNSKDIRGELHFDKWENFAHNRSLALQYAYDKTDLLFIFDADDEIVGNIILPSQVLNDEYHFKFGSKNGIGYTRVLLINNHKKFEFLSVIHEFIRNKEGNSTTSIIEGDYYIVSGRSGNRNKDPNKYLNDALILEKAYEESIKKDGFLSDRYAFYCANSYKDFGKYEDAIKWYKIVEKNKNQWDQERYTSCLYIYECYKELNQEENGFFYLVKSFLYDKQRVECLYYLLVYYCCNNMHDIGYNYYLNVKDFFENNYLKTNNLINKLFICSHKLNFYVPYYMIIIADKVKDYRCGINMFKIIFTKKHELRNDFYIKNLLYNLQFFIKDDLIDNDFINLTYSYIDFLTKQNNMNLNDCKFLLNDVFKNNGFYFDKYFIKEVKNKNNKFTQKECIESNNILIYVGFSEKTWNYSYMLNNALGGSEKAVNYIANVLPKKYKIYVSGNVIEEKFDNIEYIHLNKLNNLIDEIPFHTVIVSRYIGFYEMFQKCSFYKSYIWAHDTYLFPYGCDLKEEEILLKWNNYINGCICLTDWHKNLFLEKYPILKDKITIINNGIDVNCFNKINIKIKNKFIYTSRPERGLDILLNLWPNILQKIPDATLVISSYEVFPENHDGISLLNLIHKYPNSIKYLGKLTINKLYEEMTSSEYWLYPTTWPETSCITALEMLASQVICLYYPVAGLVNTIGDYGIQVESGNEIQTILSLTKEQKIEMREKGSDYANSCSWSNRAKQFDMLINENQKKWIVYFHPDYMIYQIDDYINSLKSKFNIEFTSDRNTVLNGDYDELSLLPINSLEQIHHDFYVNLYKKINENNIVLSILDLEPLNNSYRLSFLINNYNYLNKQINKQIKIYTYSLSNISILNLKGIDKTEHLPYIIYKTENDYLTYISKSTHKSYDFGIISNSNTIDVERRKVIVDFLIKKGYSVYIISGWGKNRDNKLAECKIILNIHGFFAETSLIFEHIRCDRLLAAGYKILSETSLYLDEDFIKSNNNNLKIISYDEFFNSDFYKNLDWLDDNLKIQDDNLKIQNLLSCHKNINIFQIKIFVIHYKKLTDRKNSILKQFKKFNLTNYEFIEIDRDELNLYNTDIFDKNFGNALSAISLSHYLAYKKIIENYDNAIIFEDDIILNDNFTTIFKKYLIELPDDYDALFIGDGCNAHVKSHNLIENKCIYKRNLHNTEGIFADNGLTRCADSYFISKNCCIKLINYMNSLKTKINESIDAWLEIALLNTKCNVYWAEPTIVTQGSQNGIFDRSWYNLNNNNNNNFIKFFEKIDCSTFFKQLSKNETFKIENLRFYYGINQNHIDITDAVFKRCMINNEITIPGDCNERATLFTDPMFGIIKNIYISYNEEYCVLLDNTYTYIDINTKTGYNFDSIDPNMLTCYKSPYKKSRIGKDFDGGYIICNIPYINYDVLLSCGISDDISFEENFCNIYKNTKCIAYDGTIENIMFNNKNITFIKKNINTFNDNNNSNLHSEIDNFNNIFLKMDIEGYEIPWINSLSNEKLNKLSQIVIEFHFPFSYKEVSVFNKLNKNHILVHFHPNNCLGVRNHKGILIPNVFECTYIHKKYYTNEYLLNDEKIPSSLDMKNVIENPEIYLDYEPFVFKNKNTERSLVTNHDNTSFKRKNICFIHSCHIKNKGLKRLENLILKIKQYGLIDILEKIYINNIGIQINDNTYGDKFHISNYSNEPKLYEIPTINKIKNFALENPNYNILYLHTKGISYDDNNKMENDWIDMMLYFLVKNFNICIDKLNTGIQAVGCNYYNGNYDHGVFPPCFSGNFWWADSNYIYNLPYIDEKIENIIPNSAEFWLCQNNPHFYEPHNSKINHYHNEYPKEKYCKNYNLNLQTKSELVINKLSDTYSSAWLGHMKFAFFLVNLLKPSVIVDLGVDFGHSTFSFASAQQGIVFGIDSFEGDVQAGLKNTFDVVNKLNNDFITQDLLINNIKFIKGYFDDVFNYFNESIDILHIDGLHTIEAVSNDYNKWITKTNDNAVILFHDVMSYPDSVGKVFNDIQYPKFYFTHSAGLGIVCKNQKLLNYILSNTELPNKEYIIYNKPKEENVKIIDCFIFYNEIELLTYRLNLLNDFVDYFILIESKHTFVGNEKPLFYNDNKDMFSKFNHKIIHIIVDDFPYVYPYINIQNNEQWINEKFQRNCISRGIDKLKLCDKDVITITDIDEIPNPIILQKIKNNEIIIDINIIELDFYYYNLNNKMDHQWYHSKILTFQKYKQLNISCEAIRFYNCPVIKKAGWHLSYFGDKSFIKNKILNFSHQELNKTEFTDETKIENRINNGYDLFDRNNNIIHIDIENNNNLPPLYDTFLKKFYKIN